MRHWLLSGGFRAFTRSAVGSSAIRGVIEALAIWGVDMAYLPFDRAAWWEGKPLLAYARPEIFPFALMVLAVVRGTEGGYRTTLSAPKPGSLSIALWSASDALHLLAHGISLWLAFLTLTCGRHAWRVLPSFDLILFGAWTSIGCASAWWAVAMATHGMGALFGGILVALGRSHALGRYTVGLALVQVLEAGRLQPVHEMLPILETISFIVPLRWGLEATTITLDAQFGMDLPARVCHMDARACAPQDTVSFAGGMCYQPNATSPRKYVAPISSYIDSPNPRYVEALAGLVATNGSDPHSAAVADQLRNVVDQANRAMSYCFNGQTLERSALPVFLVNSTPESNHRVWEALLLFDGDLALYRANRYGITFFALVLLCIALAGASRLACWVALRIESRRLHTNTMPEQNNHERIP